MKRALVFIISIAVGFCGFYVLTTYDNPFACFAGGIIGGTGFAYPFLDKLGPFLDWPPKE